MVSHFWPRRFDTRRFPVESWYYPTEPGVQVLIESQRPVGETRGEIVLVHGLESSGRAGYVLSMAQAALEAGYAVHRFNMRSCGGTEHLSHTFYNAGLTVDLRMVLEEMARRGRAPVHVVGYSLGGNLVVKLAGEWGEAARPFIASVCGVSASIDLEASCRAILRPGNFIYHRRFVRRLIARTKRRLEAHPEMKVHAGFDRASTIVEFDDMVTGPAFGFRDAVDYYQHQSATRFLDGIRVPTQLIYALDDPIIPASMYDHPSIVANPCIHRFPTAHGGHVGFIARGKHRFWLDYAVLEWIHEVGERLHAAEGSCIC
jgi:predicted alpha/beta-fold hydrolase